VSEEREDWRFNYFNYFTEVEEHFQQARGTALFLMSPLDWALIETWKNAGIPIEAVLRGIDVSFEKWRGRKIRTQKVNSLVFCTQAVMAEAEVLAGVRPARRPAPAPFELAELRAYLEHNAGQLSAQSGAAFREIAASLERLAAEAETHHQNLEDLERRLTVLEEKMVAAARSSQTEESLLAARRELDRELRPYRGKMTADQLAMLEKQYLERRLLESAGLPRLSLFYLR
jgi:hypothetical protein